MSFNSFISKLFIKKKGFPNCTKPFNVLVIADTHGCFSEENAKALKKQLEDQIELVIYLGDITSSDYEKIMACILNKVDVIGVLGNHNNKDDLDKLGIINVEKQQFALNGVTFSGINGSLKYKKSDNALITDEESIKIAKSLPGSDVFLTHDGPKIKTDNFAHSGLKGISEYIASKKPSVHLYGHLHKPDTKMIKSTESICVYETEIFHISKEGISHKRIRWIEQ